MAAPTAILSATYVGRSTSNGNFMFGTSYDIYHWDGDNFFTIVKGRFIKIDCSFFVTDEYYLGHQSDFEEPS